MSKLRIQEYYREVERAIEEGGSSKESSIRRYFANLIEYYAKSKKITLVDETLIKNSKGQTKFPDGTLLMKGVKVGFWESKDSKDKLEQEIIKKFEIGYPQYNIIFEDSQRIILYQAPNRLSKGEKKIEANMQNWDELHEVLMMFVNYEIEEVRTFREALSHFSEFVPKIAQILQAVISISAGETTINSYDTALQIRLQDATLNQDFINERLDFWKSCQDTINPNISVKEIDEMIIQHILTENIFNTIFNETQFHRENNISKQIAKVIDTFFYAELRANTINELDRIYTPIIEEAKRMHFYREKQNFLKLIYEEFYKAFNPKDADRLGIVYTPSEVVQFILKTTDYFLHKHLQHTMSDKNVHILDPATGTGTFICDIIEYLDKANLEYKYLNEIHANEISILPYYIANLNIEYTYKERMGKYKAFPNICFVDTLDNLGGMVMGEASISYAVSQNMFAVSKENSIRIQKQNQNKISVIIGNPPYNSQQKNENDNNKNREYKHIDKRIKVTYIAESTAQKTYQYDMYKRFIRWASDRLGDKGIIAFIINRSFIDKRQDDGFRKTIAKEFDYSYIVDLGGDVRADGAAAADNVFGIMTGVAVLFLIRTGNKK